MRTDNRTACRILNYTLKQNRSKAIDIIFYWLIIDRVEQVKFRIY